jgi:hypothetical protein
MEIVANAIRGVSLRIGDGGINEVTEYAPVTACESVSSLY